MSHIAILLYIYHTYEWDELKILLLNINNVKLFLALSEFNDNSQILHDCDLYFPEYEVIYTKNKGLDLGPFLQQLKTLNSHKYPLFIKLHARQLIQEDKYNWSVNLLNSLIGSDRTLQQNIRKIQSNKHIGSLCNRNFILDKHEGSCKFQIEHLCSILNITVKQVRLGTYMSGGIFLGKTKIFKKYLTRKAIVSIYKHLEDCDPSSEDVGQYTQALECTLSYIINIQNSEIHEAIDPVLKIQQGDNILHTVLTYKNTCYLKYNPHIRGTVTDNNDDSINILWDTVDVSSNSLSDVSEYKLLHTDLRHLSDEEAHTHFIEHGKKEGRVYNLKEIKDVFDIEYYSNRYGISYDDAFEDYIHKGRHEGRIYSSKILERNFDYGFYISYYKHFKQTYNNQFKSFKSFLRTNKKGNNLINFKKKGKNIKKTVCIYIADTSSSRGVYCIKNNIAQLLKICNLVILITPTDYNSFNKNIVNITVPINNDIHDIWVAKSILESIHNIPTNFKNYILITDKAFILKDLTETLLTFQSNNIEFLSMTDSYTKGNSSSNYYHLHLECLFFNHTNIILFIKFIKKYIQTYKSSTNTLEIELSAFLLKNKKIIGALLTPTHEIEILWNILLNVEINLLPNLLYKYNIPIINSDTIAYYYQLITNNFKKTQNTFLIPEWLSLLEKNTVLSKHNKSVCVVIHIHTMYNINEYIDVLDKLTAKINNITFYITGNVDAFNVLKTYSNKMFYFQTENRGMDIGPFLKLIDMFYNNNINFDYIVKIQDKQTKAWRIHCIENIISNITHYIDMLEEENVSICGSYTYLTPLDFINHETIDSFIKRYKIPFNYLKESRENSFIAGTMFIVKQQVLNEFIKTFNIDLDYEHLLLEEGRVLNNVATQTHAWERILTCVMPIATRTKLKCI